MSDGATLPIESVAELICGLAPRECDVVEAARSLRELRDMAFPDGTGTDSDDVASVALASGYLLLAVMRTRPVAERASAIEDHLVDLAAAGLSRESARELAETYPSDWLEQLWWCLRIARDGASAEDAAFVALHNALAGRMAPGGDSSCADGDCRKMLSGELERLWCAWRERGSEDALAQLLLIALLRTKLDAPAAYRLALASSCTKLDRLLGSASPFPEGSPYRGSKEKRERLECLTNLLYSGCRPVASGSGAAGHPGFGSLFGTNRASWQAFWVPLGTKPGILAMLCCENRFASQPYACLPGMAGDEIPTSWAALQLAFNISGFFPDSVGRLSKRLACVDRFTFGWSYQLDGSWVAIMRERRDRLYFLEVLPALESCWNACIDALAPHLEATLQPFSERWEAWKRQANADECNHALAQDVARAYKAARDVAIDEAVAACAAAVEAARDTGLVPRGDKRSRDVAAPLRTFLTQALDRAEKPLRSHRGLAAGSAVAAQLWAEQLMDAGRRRRLLSSLRTMFSAEATAQECLASSNDRMDAMDDAAGGPGVWDMSPHRRTLAMLGQIEQLEPASALRAWALLASGDARSGDAVASALERACRELAYQPSGVERAVGEFRRVLSEASAADAGASGDADRLAARLAVLLVGTVAYGPALVLDRGDPTAAVALDDNREDACEVDAFMTVRLQVGRRRGARESACSLDPLEIDPGEVCGPVPHVRAIIGSGYSGDVIRERVGASGRDLAHAVLACCQCDEVFAGRCGARGMDPGSLSADDGAVRYVPVNGDGEGVSRIHAALFQAFGTYWLCDLGSTNGTAVLRSSPDGDRVFSVDGGVDGIDRPGGMPLATEQARLDASGDGQIVRCRCVELRERDAIYLGPKVEAGLYPED